MVMVSSINQMVAIIMEIGQMTSSMAKASNIP